MAKATLVLHERVVLREAVFAELRIHAVPDPVPGSSHGLKYSLALVARGACVLRFDNERGKGDHWHGPDGVERSFVFEGIDALLGRFWTEVDRWMRTDAS
jgi:hypothetical protein